MRKEETTRDVIIDLGSLNFNFNCQINDRGHRRAILIHSNLSLLLVVIHFQTSAYQL